MVFRLKKKDRRRWRKSAQQTAEMADKLALNGLPGELVALVRGSAETYLKIAHGKKRRVRKSTISKPGR